MTDHKSSVVGVFDSGVGGFSVLKELRTSLQADIVYFGDCARAPYGNRPLEEIITFIQDIVRQLQKDEVTHFVSACNSMSVLTTDVLLEDLGIDNTRYTDMFRSFKKYNYLLPKSRVLVIGTKATVESRVYQDYLEKYGHIVFDYIPHTLAGVIEQSANEEELRIIIEPIISYACAVEATHILFACTHYPLVRHIFEEAKKKFLWRGDYIDPAVYVRKEVGTWGLCGQGTCIYKTSKETEVFKRLQGKI